MRSIAILLAGATVIVAIGMAVSAAQPDPAKTLRSVQAFASIADEKERSLALFQEAGKVITHARCVNCHPAGDRPAQGDDRHPHSRWSCAVSTISAPSACAARPATGRRTSMPGRHPGPSRVARGADRDGVGRQVAGRDLRADQGSRSATAASRWRSSSIIWPRIRSSAGAGIRASAASRRPARSRSSAS